MTEVSDDLTDLIDLGDLGEQRPNRVAPWIAMAIAITMVGLFVVLIGADSEGGLA